ncbi:hypothetical protein GUJ93_ZPchr0007g5840 [Zizania palustris]|uniref:Uncharacterized protein n=1 Tax=Zizania palustris TaxID=103762 RepID=A0A8J5SQS3_ZIZPA|nr:hypothetical protein GUJ93_ZPchr0007g5840 [Zizania palustris]
MGNCLERSRGAAAVDDDDAVHCAATKERAAPLAEEEKEMLNKGERAPPAPVTEVKIRITRKQLEELLRGLEAAGNDGGGADISQLLCMTSSCNFRHRPPQWRPSLHSIPE